MSSLLSRFSGDFLRSSLPEKQSEEETRKIDTCSENLNVYHQLQLLCVSGLSNFHVRATKSWGLSVPKVSECVKTFIIPPLRAQRLRDLCTLPEDGNEVWVWVIFVGSRFYLHGIIERVKWCGCWTVYNWRCFGEIRVRMIKFEVDENCWLWTNKTTGGPLWKSNRNQNRFQFYLRPVTLSITANGSITCRRRFKILMNDFSGNFTGDFFDSGKKSFYYSLTVKHFQLILGTFPTHKLSQPFVERLSYFWSLMCEPFHTRRH